MGMQAISRRAKLSPDDGGRMYVCDASKGKVIEAVEHAVGSTCDADPTIWSKCDTAGSRLWGPRQAWRA